MRWEKIWRKEFGSKKLQKQNPSSTFSPPDFGAWDFGNWNLKCPLVIRPSSIHQSIQSDPAVAGIVTERIGADGNNPI
jgi:hypothetical protein